MKVLVTGASGRIGRFVIEELEPRHSLVLFSRRHPRDGVYRLATDHPHVAGDLRDAEAVRRAVQGVDAVAHLGANPWFGADTFETNVMGTVHLLEACREFGVRRVVHAGSDWGVAKDERAESPPDYLPVDEAHPCRPNDEYGLSKAVCERVAETYARVHGIVSAVMRITGVWTPEQIAAYAAAGKGTVERDGAKYWWSYVDVRDVARAFRLALEAPTVPRFGTYFLSAADTTLEAPTLDVVRRRWPQVDVRGPLPGRASLLSGAAARDAFGFEPKHSWASGSTLR